MKFIKEGATVRVVVFATGTGRAVERVKVGKVEGDKAYIHGLDVPFSMDTGICDVNFLPGMQVMLEPDVYEQA